MSLWSWFLRLLGIRPDLVAPPGEPVAPTRPVVAPASRQRPHLDDAHEQGEFYFRDTILDELDHAFRVLPRVKARDESAYGFFATVGAQVCPVQSAAPLAHVEPFVTGALPAMGGVFLSAECGDDPDTAYPRLAYFEKFKLHRMHECELPAPDETAYVVSLYYDELDESARRAVTNYCVAVGPGGAVRCLRHLIVGQPVYFKTRGQDWVTPNGRVVGGGSRGVYRVPARKWARAGCLEEWALRHREDPHDVGERLFVWLTRLWEQMVVGSMVRVAVSKGGLTCCFAVNILRTPYFFADRDVKAEGRKKIFHIVRTHTRQLGNRETIVRTHFRGARRFTWNGYEVLITVPGWHHNGVERFSATGVDETTLPPEEARRFIERGEAGRRIAAHIGDAEVYRSNRRRGQSRKFA